jgi:hypothetical protein
MRDADSGLVPDELHSPAARWINDGQPTRHRLDDGARARILDLRVQQRVRAPKDIRRVALRVTAEEVDAIRDAELGEQRRRIGREPPAHEQASIRQLRERAQRELEPVRLRLIPAEEQHGPAVRRRSRRREVLDVDSVVEHLPRPRRRSQKQVGRELAELALVQHVLGREQGSTVRPVQALGIRAGEARIGDAVLVENDRDPAAPRQREQRPQVARQPRRAQIDQREVPWIVREALREALELRGAAGDGLAGRRNAVVPVEDAHTASVPPRNQQ